MTTMGFKVLQLREEEEEGNEESKSVGGWYEEEGGWKELRLRQSEAIELNGDENVLCYECVCVCVCYTFALAPFKSNKYK